MNALTLFRNWMVELLAEHDERENVSTEDQFPLTEDGFLYEDNDGVTYRVTITRVTK